MGRIKATQRLVVEDFPDQKDWIGKMFFIVNRFITDVVAALNGNIVFEQNITGQEIDLDFVYVSAAASFPLEFQWKLAARPKALQVCSALEGSATVGDSAIMVVLAWSFTEDEKVRISDAVKLTSAPAAANLTVGKRYKIKVRVTP